MLLILTAGAAPLDDAVRLFGHDGHVCAERTSGPPVCWGGKHDRAVPTPGAVPGPPGPPDSRGKELVRLADGSVQHRGRRIEGLTDPRANSLFLADDHACAIERGRVACWGSDLQNGRGDGGGPSARFTAPMKAGSATSRDLACKLDAGVVTCAADWAGPAGASRAPVRIDDVQRFEMAGGLACALRSDRQLYCFGRNDDGMRFPEAPVGRDVVDFSLGHVGVGAFLTKGGAVFGTIEDFATFEELFTAPGASRVVMAAGMVCAVEKDGLACLGGDEGARFRVPAPKGELVLDRWENLCDTGTGTCVDVVNPGLVLDTHVTFVELGG